MDEQIIEAMLSGWFDSEKYTRRMGPADGFDYRMRAVYAVVEQHLRAKHAGEMLGPVTEEELQWAQDSAPATERMSQRLERVLQYRKRRFLAPKPKERVTIKPPTPGMRETHWKVLLDGAWKSNQATAGDALIYAAGLRAELEGK